MEIKTKTFRESVYAIIEALQKEGTIREVFQAARDEKKADIYGGDTCLEISPMTNIIENPLELFPVIPGRGNHFVMQLAEIIWVLHGSYTLNDFFGQFASPVVQKFAEGTDVLHAGYGKRIRNQPDGHDLLKYVVDTLEEKLTTRSAIIPIMSAELDTFEEGHKPCVTSVNFHWFKGKLDCIMSMRATDVIKGYSAINFLEFAFLQAVVAYCIDIPVGRFVNFTTTMHHYMGSAKERIDNIMKYKPVNVPDLTARLDQMFSQSLGKSERYNSVLADVATIYQNLGTEVTRKKEVTFVHPIFAAMYKILSGYKFKEPIKQVSDSLPEFLDIPFLENAYRDNSDEARTIIEEKYPQWKEILTWRDHNR